MEILVGTSGWSNPLWNPNGLSWYAQNSGLNAIELNMSFYQMPHKDQINAWADEGRNLLWTVKVNRSVTHFFRFNDTALERFFEFKKIFAPLDQKIAYYLFQLPPNAHPAMRKDIESFYHKSKLGERFALEWRNQKWFSKEYIDWAKSLGITIVSADSQIAPREIFMSSKTVYLRLQGRSDWFQHYYSRRELSRISKKIIETGCKRVIAFLDNDSAQLKNAQTFLAKLKEQAAIV